MLVNTNVTLTVLIENGNIFMKTGPNSPLSWHFPMDISINLHVLNAVTLILD